MGLFKRLFKDFSVSSDEPEKEQIRRVNSEPFIALGGSLLVSCDRIPSATGRFGHDIHNPIPVNGVGGEIVYLNTLRARTGVGVFFHRIGSVRTPSYPNPIDNYEVVGVDASQWARLYFTMYHPRRSREVPTGFDRRSWSSLSREMKAMIHLPGMGTTDRVVDFPMGLPVALQASANGGTGYAKLASAMASRVQRLLDKSAGKWARPTFYDKDNPTTRETIPQTTQKPDWYVKCLQKYRLTKEDMQPMSTISGFAWKYGGMEPLVAVEYAMRTIYFSRHGAPQEKNDAKTTWKSAVQWSTSEGVNSIQWGIQCIKIARGRSESLSE